MDALGRTFTLSRLDSKLAMMLRAKVLILGPPASGKTVLANFLSDATESIAANYRPTKGVRILEFENEKMRIKGRKINAEVELWDCGSDSRAEMCWPMFAQNINGIIFVFNSGVESHPKYLERAHTHFIRKMALLRDSQCIIFSNRKSEAGQGSEASTSLNVNHLQPPPIATGRFERNDIEPLRYQRDVPVSMREITCVATDVTHAPEELRAAFENYLHRILGTMAEQADKMEQSILSTDTDYIR